MVIEGKYQIHSFQKNTGTQFSKTDQVKFMEGNL